MEGRQGKVKSQERGGRKREGRERRGGGVSPRMKILATAVAGWRAMCVMIDVGVVRCRGCGVCDEQS